MLEESIRKEIVDNLKPLNPVRVILFGSYAYGTPTKDSDIDLYIVTKDNHIPENFEENFKIKKKVYMALNDFRSKYDSDIIVHTLPVYKKFLEINSSFFQEINEKGIRLI